MKKIILILITLFCLYIAGYSQDLSVQWNIFEPQFEEAIEQSGGVCIIAMGVLEKHGPHMAVGTGCLVVHNLCVQAAQKEYAVVFHSIMWGRSLRQNTNLEPLPIRPN